MKKLTLLLIVVMALFALSPLAAQAVHKSSSGLDCSGCHVMHGTDGAGTTVGPYNSLLSEASTEALCLACHDTSGSRYGSYSSVVPAVVNATGQPAAGDFGDLDTASGDAASTANGGRGHNLGAGGLSLTPAGSANGPVSDFSCTSCHDAHGTDADTATLSAYRNLRGVPTGSGSGSSVIIRASSTSALSGDVYPLSGNIYGAQGTGLSNFSAWCASCHDNFYGDSNTGTASPFQRHPTSNASSTYNVTTAYLAVASGSRYPAEDTLGSSTANTGPYGNDAGDSVFCLTCHYAHAGPNSDALRWSYEQQAQASPGSACQQCHDK